MAGGLDLLGAMGGSNGAAAPEDDLLKQIRALLEQYLQLGANTPVAAEAQALMQAIDSTQGGATTPPPGDAETPVEEALPTEESDSLPKTYDEAQAGAKGFLMQANKKKKTKAT